MADRVHVRLRVAVLLLFLGNWPDFVWSQGLLRGVRLRPGSSRMSRSACCSQIQA
jgi:hypothetical protein